MMKKKKKKKKKKNDNKNNNFDNNNVDDDDNNDGINKNYTRGHFRVPCFKEAQGASHNIHSSVTACLHSPYADHTTHRELSVIKMYRKNERKYALDLQAFVLLPFCQL